MTAGNSRDVTYFSDREYGPRSRTLSAISPTVAASSSPPANNSPVLIMLSNSMIPRNFHVLFMEPSIDFFIEIGLFPISIIL